jgi:hypothetical protein
MYILLDDSEKDMPGKYFGGTVSTSGSSAVIPENNPSFYRNIKAYELIFKDDPDIKAEYNKKIRDLFIKQIEEDAKKDEETYQSQKIYGKWIFIVVILLVFTGIVFSIIQLCNALKYGNFTQLTTSIEIQGAGGVILTTSLVGAFVLTISFLFFFLFLQFVYKPNNKQVDFYKNIKSAKQLLDKE